MNPITTNFAYTGGLQTYNVTVTGTYDLSGFGAGGAGGNNTAAGSGAEIGGTFNLTAGQQLFIIVGGQGGANAGNGGGGGGFSEIYTRDANNNITPLLIAGGGGGGAGGIGPNGSNATVGAIGPGTGGTSGSVSGSGGGAGANSNGANGTNTDGVNSGGGGFDAANGAGGGTAGTFGGAGGYGGGGGAFGSGGGGGGYTGGIGGSNTGLVGGGGGTSYQAGTLNAAETRAGAGVSTGNGSVRINLLPAAPAPAPTPTPTPTPPANNAPCYVTGTRIRVLRGLTVRDVAVEALAVGDLALTAVGKPRPIRWIGSRSYTGLNAPQTDRPVRIRAGAVSPGVPARDLLVSPDHCLWLDGPLVAAGHLVNGTSIIRGEAVANLTYWHVELDTHDMLLAEGAAAESFLAAPGVRAGFDGVQALDAGARSVPYAPRAELGSDLAALRGRLALRACGAAPGPVRAWLDRCAVGADGLLHVAGWARDEARPDVPVCLDILVDGAVVAFAVANEHRADLAAPGVGGGRHGFDLGLDAALSPNQAHTVAVRRSADGLLVAAKAVDATGEWTALLAA